MRWLTYLRVWDCAFLEKGLDEGEGAERLGEEQQPVIVNHALLKINVDKSMDGKQSTYYVRRPYEMVCQRN